MRKDFHFYCTYALARKVGLPADLAAKIAWADQYTDELVKAETHGIQTSSAIIGGNWLDPQIQRTVLVTFHFLPGDNIEQPWMVTEASRGAVKLLNEAIGDELGFGIALHTFQDTFSHQGWTGWKEPFNACGNILPNIGHADVGHKPDEPHRIWTDPRTKKQINNRKRAIRCAEMTFVNLCRFGAAIQSKPAFTIENRQRWNAIAFEFREIFEIAEYDERKKALIKLAGHDVGYSDIDSILKSSQKREFAKAASKQLAVVTEMIKNLPGPI